MRTLLLSLVFLASACHNKEGSTVVEATSAPLASGVQITKVAVYQGIEKVIYDRSGKDGAGFFPSPVIMDHSANLRVHYKAQRGETPPQSIQVVVEVLNNGTLIGSSSETVFFEESNQKNLDSTAMLSLSPIWLSPENDLIVSLRSPSLLPTTGSGTTEDSLLLFTGEATAEANDLTIPMVKSDHVKIVLVPVRYKGDGSGRVPNITPSRIAEIEEAFNVQWPAQSVEIIVDPIYPVDYLIEPNYNNWQQFLFEMITYRAIISEEYGENTYVFGLFKPTPKMEGYCEYGCVLGLATVASTGDTAFRAGIGVDFDEQTIDTMLHEIGHAHGREHAPCGVYDEPDRNFPYNDLGSYGYDPTTNILYTPNTAQDTMSYCSPQWFSDYTYQAIANRVIGVMALDSERSATTKKRFSLHQINAQGESVSHTTITSSVLSNSTTREFIDKNGQIRPAHFAKFDHLPGGVLLTDEAVLGGHLK